MIDWRTEDVLLETSYIDRCIWYILLMKRRIVPVQLEHVAITSVIKKDECVQVVDTVSVEHACKDPMKKDLITDGIALPIRVVKRETIRQC